MDKFTITRAWLDLSKARTEGAEEVTLPGEQMRALLVMAEHGLDAVETRERRASEVIVRQFFRRL